MVYVCVSVCVISCAADVIINMCYQKSSLVGCVCSIEQQH